MIETTLRVLLSLLIPAGLGSFILFSIHPKRSTNFLYLLSLSYLVGSGTIAVLMFILCILNFKLILFHILAAIIFFAIGLFILVRKNFLFNYLCSKPLESNSFKKIESREENIYDTIKWLGIIFLVYLTFIIFYFALIIPVNKYDEFFYIATKGKVIFYDQSLINLKNLPWPSYPLFVQLSMVFVSQIVGQWHDQWIKIIFPANYLALLLFMIYFLTVITNIRWAIAGGVLLVSSLMLVFHGTIGYSDLTLSVFNCTTIFLIILWAREKFRGYLILAALLSSFTTFIKLEGVGYFLIHSALVASIILFNKNSPWTKQSSKIIFFVLPAVAMVALHNLFKWGMNIPLDERTSLDFNIYNLARIPSILFNFRHDFFFSGNWQIIWFLLVISILKNLKHKYTLEIKLLLLSLFLFLSFYLFLGCFTNHYDFIGGNNSKIVLSRLILHFYPLTPALVVLLNYSGKSNT